MQFEKLSYRPVVDPQGKPARYFLTLDSRFKDALKKELDAKTVKTGRFLPANPTGTASAAAVMMGLGGVVKYTPSLTGNVEIVLRGTMANTLSGDGITARLAYGTGTAPANAAAAAGTATGATGRATVAANNQGLPFMLTDILTGLVLSTAYWFDLQVAAVTGGTASVSDLAVTIKELP